MKDKFQNVKISAFLTRYYPLNWYQTLWDVLLFARFRTSTGGNNSCLWNLNSLELRSENQRNL